MQSDILSRLLAGRPSLGPVAVGFVGLVCAVPLVWVIYQDVLIARSGSIEIPANRAVSPPRPTAVSVETLTTAHFFGAGSSLQSAQRLQQERVPETRMSLQLQGVIGSTVAEEARALIAQKGQRAEYYGINASLPGGASIHSITSTHVVLSRNGLLETLSFPKPQSHAVSSSLAADNPAGPSETEDSSSRFQQLHESQVADYAVDESSYAKSQPEESTQAPVSIKERLKQLRESRDL